MTMKRFHVSFNLDIGTEETSEADITMWLIDAIENELLIYRDRGERVGYVEVKDLGTIQE